MALHYLGYERVTVCVKPSELYETSKLPKIIEEKIRESYLGRIHHQGSRTELQSIETSLRNTTPTQISRPPEVFYSISLVCKFAYMSYIVGETLFNCRVKSDSSNAALGQIVLTTSEHNGKEIVVQTKSGLAPPFTANLQITAISYNREIITASSEEMIYSDIIDKSNHTTLRPCQKFNISFDVLSNYTTFIPTTDFAYDRIYPKRDYTPGELDPVVQFFTHPFSLLLNQETPFGQMMVNAFMRDEAISYDQLQLEMVEIDAICRKLEGAYAPSPNPPRIELPENLDTAVAERIMGNSVEHLRSEEDGNYSSIFFDLHGGKDPDTSAYVTTKRFTNFEDSPVQITDLVSKYDIVYLIRPLTVEPSSTVFYAIAFSERPRAITLSLEDKTKLMHGLGYFYKCIVEANAFLHQMEKATFAELIRQNYQTEGNEITTAVISEIFQSDRDKRTILHRYLDIQTYIAKSFSDVDTTDTEYSTGNDRAIVSSHLRIG